MNREVILENILHKNLGNDIVVGLKGKIRVCFSQIIFVYLHKFYLKWDNQ